MPILTNEIRSDPVKLAEFRASNKAKAAAWRAKNRESYNSYMKDYRENHKEELAPREKGYYETRRKNFKSNPEAMERRREVKRIYVQQKRLSDESFRMADSLRKRIRDVLIGDSRAESTQWLIGCTPEQFRAHIESQFIEGMTWENYGFGVGKWTLDHITPCAVFDLTIPEQQLKCFHYSNLRPLWYVENCAQTGKLPPLTQ